MHCVVRRLCLPSAWPTSSISIFSGDGEPTPPAQGPGWRRPQRRALCHPAEERQGLARAAGIHSDGASPTFIPSTLSSLTMQPKQSPSDSEGTFPVQPSWPVIIFKFEAHGRPPDMIGILIWARSFFLRLTRAIARVQLNGHQLSGHQSPCMCVAHVHARFCSCSSSFSEHRPLHQLCFLCICTSQDTRWT